MSEGKYLFSEHVLTIDQGFDYLDGNYGAGAWPIERLRADHCGGPVINSSKTIDVDTREGVDHPRILTNCKVVRKKAVWGLDQVCRVPLIATARVKKGEQFFHSYPISNGRMTSFRNEMDSDSDDFDDSVQKVSFHSFPSFQLDLHCMDVQQATPSFKHAASRQRKRRRSAEDSL